jgi:hypothetical protein
LKKAERLHGGEWNTSVLSAAAQTRCMVSTSSSLRQVKTSFVDLLNILIGQDEKEGVLISMLRTETVKEVPFYLKYFGCLSSIYCCCADAELFL